MEQQIKKATLTPEQLLANGWVKTGDPVVIYEKKLQNDNPINDSEDSDLKLIVHGYFNVWQFGLLLPDGGILNFVANTIEELNSFEKQILFYDPPF